MRAVSLLVFLAVIVVVVVLAVRLLGTRVSIRDVAWIAGTPYSSPAEEDVYTRYLQRHRRHRLAGGIFGMLVALVVGIRYFGSVSIGVGQQSPLGDLLFCGLAGVLLGALSAESFRLSDPPSTTVSASLEEHPKAAGPSLIRTARGIALAAIGGGGVIAATVHDFTALAIAVGGMVVVAIAEATQAAIVGRRRPVLSDRARDVDLRMRAFASMSIARLELAAAVLTAAWTFSKVPGSDTGPVALLQLLAVLGGLVTTVILLRRASPRPPRSWVAAPA